MKTVVLAENAFAPETWERHEVEDVTAFLIERLKVWPATGRIYHNEIAQTNDVTPTDEPSTEWLNQLDGTFYVIIYPAGTAVVIAVVAVVAAVAAAYFFRPRLPDVSAASRPGSSNNALSGRQNRERINGRIPDIFGTVRSTPDLLAQPLVVFEEDGLEVEYAYMSIGRGSYLVTDIREDTTPAADIRGLSVQIFGPNASPNNGAGAQLTVGDPITTQLRNVRRLSVTTEQVLRPPDTAHLIGSSNIRFEQPNIIRTNDNTIDFRDLFEVGDDVYLLNASWSTFNLDNWSGGAPSAAPYRIVEVTPDTIELDNPTAIRAQWSSCGTSPYISPVLMSVEYKKIGPFTAEDAKYLYVNVYAPNGLYYIGADGNQYRRSLTYWVEYTPVDEYNVPTGAPVTSSHVIPGSYTSRRSRGHTATITFPTQGRYRFTVYRSTKTIAGDSISHQSVNEDIECRDIYTGNDLGSIHFGDVTTVYTRTVAIEGTRGSLAVKNRKLNMLATRCVPVWIPASVPAYSAGMTYQPGEMVLYSGSIWIANTLTVGNVPQTSTSFWSYLDINTNKWSAYGAPTNRLDYILIAMCRDPYIGARQDAEIDMDGIKATIAAARTYFGHYRAVEFNYTFDKDDTSFEEMLTTAAEVAFCTPYRRGSLIKITFERETPDSTLLFNHRNKLPGSEVRTVRFGTPDDADGVEVTYTDPNDDSVRTLKYPTTSVRPKRVETVGIRNKLQAYFHVHRAWNKFNFQSVTTEFEATAEADLLLLKDRILVADNTRSETQDGELVAVNGLQLTLSVPTKLTNGQTATIFLQHYDGTVEAVGITQTAVQNQVNLNNAPRNSLSVDPDNYAKSTYIIVPVTDQREKAFLVTERQPKPNFTHVVRAVNYDDRYYQNDDDYIDGVVDANGNLI